MSQGNISPQAREFTLLVSSVFSTILIVIKYETENGYS
jgi:hypothetical protein